VLVIAGTGAQKTSEITEAVEKYAKDIKVRSKEIEGEYWEIIFEIRFNKDSLKKTDSIIDELRAKENITKVSLLAPQTALPV
jgi:hypothetical protein